LVEVYKDKEPNFPTIEADIKYGEIVAVRFNHFRKPLLTARANKVNVVIFWKKYPDVGNEIKNVMLELYVFVALANIYKGTYTPQEKNEKIFNLDWKDQVLDPIEFKIGLGLRKKILKKYAKLMQNYTAFSNIRDFCPREEAKRIKKQRETKGPRRE
jgi:hypothetical protein